MTNERQEEDEPEQHRRKSGEHRERDDRSPHGHRGLVAQRGIDARHYTRNRIGAPVAGSSSLT